MTTRLTSGGWLLLGCALMASCAQTLATSGQVSVTAEAVCALRAVAAQHPDPKVRNPDYLAEKFVSETFWRTAGYRSDPGRARHNPNYFWVNARTHHMDALLVEALSQGATQVVNLGAGFDSRAYRFRERFPRTRFFELDLPATIAAKRERVVKIFGAVPDRVALVATDFNTRPLEAVLRDAGYDRTQRTFFIWEGVTMYLPEAANRSTLQFIRSGSASGSSVAYDYLLDGALRPDGGGIYGAKTTAAYVASVGEPFLTGWSPSQAAAFATREGLVVVSDLGPAELTARYLTGSDGQPDGMMGEFQHILHARVP
ncbi:MAG TPA: SAM-dependent methyltransferase [Candidatus Acidoferrum sp.]|nr:SAM-dependent methyltransferase [Candidatus Acidoferrum sp.]